MIGGSGHEGRRLAVGFVPGVQPDKWLERWRSRRPEVPVTSRRTGDPAAGLSADVGAGGFDVIFLREPADAPRSAPPGLLRIPLYTETMAVLATKDHEIAAFDALVLDDLDGEPWLDPVDPVAAPPDEVVAAVDLVAAGVGLLILPLPYARSLGRRDVVARPVDGVPATRMGIAWSPRREGDPVIEEFVGIVRGRTANSSRGDGENRGGTPTETRREPAGARKAEPGRGRARPRRRSR